MKKTIFKTLRISVLTMALLVLSMTVCQNKVNAASSDVKAVTVKTGDESYEGSEFLGQLTASEDSSNLESVISVKANASGIMFFTYSGSNVDSVSLTLYTDEECTDSIGYSSLEASSDAVSSQDFNIPEAGTYYLQIKSYESVESIDYAIVASIYSADDQNLKNNKMVYASLLSYDDSNYYKFSIKNPGIVKAYVTYANEDESNANVDIYKKVKGKMKLISKGSASNEGTITGLVKGTYYIKLSKGSSSYYAVKYKFTAVTDKSGTKKAKAKSIKLGSTVKGLVTASDSTSKADWFKFTNTKNKKTTITLSGNVTGYVKLELYESNGDDFSGSLNISNYTDKDSGSPSIGTSGKLPKGTYYIKVTKDDKMTSGSYSIKVK